MGVSAWRTAIKRSGAVPVQGLEWWRRSRMDWTKGSGVRASTAAGISGKAGAAQLTAVEWRVRVGMDSDDERHLERASQRAPKISGRRGARRSLRIGSGWRDSGERAGRSTKRARSAMAVGRSQSGVTVRRMGRRIQCWVGSA
jgi:hypothetical protein